jgi:hypothetical protein
MTDLDNTTRPRNETPVRMVGAARFTVSTARGEGCVPVFKGGAADGSKVERVVVMLHGRLRDADAYLRSAERALAASSVAAESTLLVVPQFLASADVAHHALGADMLHWEWTAWMGGLDARGPCALSSFDVLDALVHHYVHEAREARMPKLREIVIAGHSGGAQVAHRHAIVGRSLHGDFKLRYVIANPSSYVYFDATRPYPTCADANDWKYGLENLPRYAQGIGDARTLEARYVASDVSAWRARLRSAPSRARSLGRGQCAGAASAGARAGVSRASVGAASALAASAGDRAARRTRWRSDVRLGGGHPRAVRRRRAART